MKKEIEDKKRAHMLAELSRRQDEEHAKKMKEREKKVQKQK